MHDTRPDPLDLLRPELRAALTRRGFASLTAVQEAVLAPAARGKNLRVSSQTGSGKTVAIGLVLAEGLCATAEAPANDPAVDEDAAGRTAGRDRKPEPHRGRAPRALVIAPTRELAVQVQGELEWLLSPLGLEVVSVTGGTDIHRERKRLARGHDVLVATPGRLLDHLRGGGVSCSEVAHVVLDEADRMLDMGFREELEDIVERLPAERHSHLMSATFSEGVRRLARPFQGDAFTIEGTPLGRANADIEHVAHLVGPGDRYKALVNVLLMSQGGRVIVFVQRRSDATELAEHLAEDGFTAVPFSGELAQAQRTRTLQAFRQGTVKVLVATDVAARGIDIVDIDTVVHMDLPTESDVYTHRSGRTGRAGKKGRSILLVPPPARRRIADIASRARITLTFCPVPSAKAIARRLQEASRLRIQAALESASPLDEAQLTEARDLLESCEPAELVARLLEFARPELPCPPAEVREPAPSSTKPPTPRNRDIPRRTTARRPSGTTAGPRPSGHHGGGSRYASR